MILTGNTIKEFIKENKLIEHGNLDNIHSSSYDLTASEYILKFSKNKNTISLDNREDIENMYKKVSINGGYKFKPGECILVPLEEKFNIPANICGSIRGRTSFNRLGLLTAIQHFNPGYKGKINITITNNSTNSYLIMPGIRIAQVVFEKMDTMVSDDLIYGNKNDSIYQNEDGLIGSKVYSDFIGKVVRHFKGNYYYIENICMDSETKEYVVVYRTLYIREDSNTWTRPAKMFFEAIDVNRKDNRTGQLHRFEPVDDLTIDYTKINN